MWVRVESTRRCAAWGVLIALAGAAACSGSDNFGDAGPSTMPFIPGAGQSTGGTPAARGSGGASASGSGGVNADSGGSTVHASDAGMHDAAMHTGAGGMHASDGGPGRLGDGFYRMERLNRGVVAVAVQGGVYVGFRMFGYEYDPEHADRTAYELYRDGMLIATLTDSTNYLDDGGSASSKYSVRAVLDGVRGDESESVPVWAQNYLRVPLQVPQGGTTPGSPQCETANEAYTYSANDASAADLDGDGDYEIVLKWDPSNSKDNSQSGCTGNVFIDAYELDGTRLWRIDLGRNIRAGAHYTQFIVYDLDGDGKAEMALKTAPGTRDGSGALLALGPAANDDDNADYRSIDNASGRSGYVLSGPEYLSVFEGQTGKELVTVAFDQAREKVSDWGDNYGNRVDRFLAAAAYLDDTGLPSFVMARGYYTRTTLTAWNYRGGALTQLWKFDSNVTPKDANGHAFSGQGSHSMTVANVDDDLGQEIMYGAMAIDHDGKGLCSTGYNHGDAIHIGDFVPSRPGLEFFMCNEDGKHPAYHLRDARTCEILQEGPINGADTGRCVADDVFAGNDGAEMWASSVDGMLAAESNANLGAKPGSQNFVIWWDADETRELEDKTAITKYGMTGDLESCSECASNNGTKSTPALSADLIGDWREEVIWREADSSALRLYTTTAVTQRRLFTLMHDPQYRVAIAWQNVAYNQPPHPSFQIGTGMQAPPRPNIRVQ
jgi:rhamnogalacturonan endolyase